MSPKFSIENGNAYHEIGSENFTENNWTFNASNKDNLHNILIIGVIISVVDTVLIVLEFFTLITFIMIATGILFHSGHCFIKIILLIKCFAIRYFILGCDKRCYYPYKLT